VSGSASRGIKHRASDFCRWPRDACSAGSRRRLARPRSRHAALGTAEQIGATQLYWPDACQAIFDSKRVARAFFAANNANSRKLPQYRCRPWSALKPKPAAWRDTHRP
jgi:hypothetical protein